MRKIYHLLVRLGLVFKKPTYNSKVFCIGYNKTGTTTIGKSLEMLGYNNSSFNNRIWETYKRGEIDKVLKFTAKFDSADDLPWLKQDMIPLLDEKFPNSKFIYLEREEQAWKNSVVKWRKKVFGNDADPEAGYQNYLDHQKFVMDYFGDRIGKDVIVLDIKDELGFKKLADFLGKESVQDKFPHFNKTNT